ncbi:MAG: phytanoyl-CoA dioxygenase family protein [Alphaproteobacteria bacterium]|nr:phytanoyl-CoA dioxygenase family protein [Alphaproteobacteria bacterium]
MSVVLERQANLSGDPRLAAQGFGKRAPGAPRLFDPRREADEACAFFAAEGYVVLSEALSADELAFLNAFFDRTQREHPDAWGLGARRKPHHRNQGLIYSQPLLDHPELDPFVRHPASFPIVAQLLGGEERARFAEFNFRETPKGAGPGAMNFHHDAVREDRLVRTPYMPCDWLCAIHYLTDTGPGTPCFAVVPRSNRYETLKEAYEALGEAYVEVPLYGPAGTCILYDTATFHTRLDGEGDAARRTWHQYYARGGWLRSALPTTDRYIRPPTPVLTDWNLFPERLALHPDPKIRLFFSHWNTAQGEWVASGFDPAVRAAMPRGEQ